MYICTVYTERTQLPVTRVVIYGRVRQPSYSQFLLIFRDARQYMHVCIYRYPLEDSRSRENENSRERDGKNEKEGERKSSRIHVKVELISARQRGGGRERGARARLLFMMLSQSQSDPAAFDELDRRMERL